MALKQLIRNFGLMMLYPRPLIGLAYIPKYCWHWYRFNQSLQRKKLRFADAHPSLGDWVTTTPFDPHYFFQAAWLARQLAHTLPARHVDIGSDVKLIGTLSAFVATDFMDFRPLEVSLPNLNCAQGDILTLPMGDNSVSSLSCLHVVEHIGLGRYGDSIDPQGSCKALAELARVLAPGGRLYLSVPVGEERICFNAHRIFAPETILKLSNPLVLRSFALVDDSGKFWPESVLEQAHGLHYGCGMFVLEKPVPTLST